MSQKELSASAAGDLLLGGKIFVHRLGFGAMRLTGEDIWGPPKDRNVALAFCAALWSWASISLTLRIVLRDTIRQDC